MNLRFILIILILSGCSVTRYNNTDFSSSYRHSFLQPEYRLYVSAYDSATVYYSLRQDNLLFRKEADNSVKATIVFHYKIYTSANTDAVTDSGSIGLTEIYDSLNNDISGSFRFRYCNCRNFVVIECTDVNRQLKHVYEYSFDGNNRRSSYNYKITDNFGSDLISSIVSPGMSVNIIPPSDIKNLQLRCYYRDFPLAQPPFSNNPPPVFDLHSDSSAVLSESQLEGFTFSRKGIYYFQADTFSNSGLAVFCMDEYYPLFTEASQLIESLRYLTTRKEYETLIKSNDQKKAIDEFWLEKAGNMERGRKLIRVYYGRASDANRYFTSYTEGWKTDRGMIYLLFGSPSTVYKTDREETWTYRYAQGIPACQFVFTKMMNPFTDNDYILIRGDHLQRPWYMAVDTWRSGRIAGEE